MSTSLRPTAGVRIAAAVSHAADHAIPIILDCDPGHDDAVALYLALASPRLDVLAVTTCAGNQLPSKTFRNARNLLQLAGRTDIPVHQGLAGPLRRELLIAADVHGETGLDGADLPISSAPVVSESAFDAMTRILRTAERPVTIVATGPLTNVAVLLLARPELKEKIAQISIMGGAAAGGNVTASAEFNIYVDPEAAEIVFASGLPIAMFGLDVTHRAQLFERDIDAIEKLGTPIGRTMAGLLRFYHRSTTPPLLAPEGHAEGLHMHDPCAVAYLIEPSLFTMLEARVDIVTSGLATGRTVVDARCEPGLVNAAVGFDVDQPAFARLVLDSLARLG